jgi:hypothetical protein
MHEPWRYTSAAACSLSVAPSIAVLPTTAAALEPQDMTVEMQRLLAISGAAYEMVCLVRVISCLGQGLSGGAGMVGAWCLSAGTL